MSREEIMDSVDAAVFSSDMLHNPEDRTMFLEYLKRWNREALASREAPESERHFTEEGLKDSKDEDLLTMVVLCLNSAVLRAENGNLTELVHVINNARAAAIVLGKRHDKRGQT